MSEYGLEPESKLDSILIENGKNLCFSFLIKINDGEWGADTQTLALTAIIFQLWQTGYCSELLFLLLRFGRGDCFYTTFPLFMASDLHMSRHPLATE